MANSSKTGVDRNRWPIIVLIGLVLFTVLTWAVFNSTKNNIPGTDFFIYYVAARQVTVEQGTPYDETVGEQSQMAILKRPARPGEDQLRYVYPPYGLLPILPLSKLPLPWAQATWMSFSILCLPVCVIYGFRKVSPVFLVSLFFLFPLSFGLLLGNLNIPVICILFLLAGRLPVMTADQKIEPVFLGVLLAWASVKPQFSAFFILVFLLLAFKKRIKRFLVSFFAGFIAMLTVSFMLVPDWISQWITLIRRYPAYTGGQVIITPLVDLFPADYQTLIYAGLVILCAVLIGALLSRGWNCKTTTIELLCTGTGIIFLFHPTGVSYEQMIFLLPFALWILSGWKKRPILNATIWLVMVVMSWVLLFLSLSHVWNRATYYGMYFLYSIWLMTFLVPWLPRKNGVEL